jgi:hypothetical protein
VDETTRSMTKGKVTNLDKLRTQIREMRYKDPLYRLLKEELSKQGHWKNKPRGYASPEHFLLLRGR